jgi:2-hydroxychromene-2-carboxylate isomerase
MAGLPAAPAQPIFYYDLGSPACYLVAEQIIARLPEMAEWEPVFAEQIGGIELDPDRESLRRQVGERGMQPLRWPATWPPDTRVAMLTATYAKRVGRAVAFSLAAFRQAFAGGRDLGDADTVLIAAAACEMHPTAVLKGIKLRSVGQALEVAGGRALAAGVGSLPAIQVGSHVFEGDRSIDLARSALTAGR